MHLQNLHTHSVFYDGVDTPEEILLAAKEKGFSSIGFSEHSYMDFSSYFLQFNDRTEEYKKEILRLKEKYKGDIGVYLGLEVDMFSKTNLSGFDYLIGSVHCLETEDGIVEFDRSAEVVEGIINKYFGGDGMEYAKAYFKTVAKLPSCGNFDILGHFDLITKHSDNHDFFDVTSEEYISAAIEAIKALAGKIPFFELNTGAVARGYRKSPYPAEIFIKEFKKMGFGAVITSDCHNCKMLDFEFSRAEEILKKCGFSEKYILTDDGFKAVSI